MMELIDERLEELNVRALDVALALGLICDEHSTLLLLLKLSLFGVKPCKSEHVHSYPQYFVEF